MDKTLLKQGGKFTFSHILMIVISFAIYYVFGWLFDRIGMFRYSLVCAVIYIFCIYTEAWKWGKKEAKKHNEIVESPIRALMASLVPFAVCIVFVLCMLFNYKELLVSIVAKVWYMPFMGFFDLTSNINYAEVILAGLALPAIMTLGYYAGMKNFTIIENLRATDGKKKMTSIAIVAGSVLLVAVLAITNSGYKIELNNSHWALRNHTLSETLNDIEKAEEKLDDTAEGKMSEDKTVLSYENAKCIGYDCPLEYTEKDGKITMKYSFSELDTSILASELTTRLGEAKEKSEEKIEWELDGYIYEYNIDGNNATLEITAK